MEEKNLPIPETFSYITPSQNDSRFPKKVIVVIVLGVVLVSSLTVGGYMLATRVNRNSEEMKNSIFPKQTPEEIENMKIDKNAKTSAPVILKKIITPTPTSNPILSPTSTPKPTPTLTPSPTPQIIVKIDSITPTSGNYGSEITIKGSNFGYVNGSVSFYNSSGINSGGSTIVSWSDSEVKGKVPFVKSDSDYQVEVGTSNGKKSNRIAFRVLAGQPIISSIAPSSMGPGDEIIIDGSGFGSNTGSVNFHQVDSPDSASGGSVITSWSDTQIKGNVPGILAPNTEYGIQIITSDGRRSSFKYYQVGN